MTRSRRQPDERPPAPAHLVVPRDQFERELGERISIGNELLDRPIDSPPALEAAKSDYFTWTEYNTEFLRRRFTTSEVADEYSRPYGGVVWDMTFAEKVEDLRDDVRDKLRRLDSIKQRIPLFEESAEAKAAPHVSEAEAPSAIEAIFIVHGRNETIKLAVHGLLRQITDVESIILHDQPSEGRTIIEKFEAVGSRAGFAVVLLTADDVARLRQEEEAALVPRARQNVVWEFGFFVGALGRRHVAVIHEEGVENPSDVDGLVYIPYDAAGGWKLLLARELHAAGVTVDTTKLL